MITLFGTLLGFFGALVPEILKMFRDTADRKHELDILKLQIEQQRLGYENRLEEIKVYSDISESQNLYKTFYSGIKWVDALNATVRPLLAYFFFILYAFMKIFLVNYNNNYLFMWTEEDQAIFAGIIAFYFGHRAFAKLRGQ